MDEKGARTGLLRPGETVWRTATADRLAFLVDAEAYFRAFRAAAAQAWRQILILGWDVDSRLDLRRSGPDDGLPPQLGEFLDTVVRRAPGLEARILIWKPAIIFALEREMLPELRLEWLTHARMHFEYDDHHPPGAAHHQKLVVLDDRTAFTGGIDLTGHRWDTRVHRPDDPLRVNPWGTPYGPYHDVQALVSGEVAQVLGDLARERWRRATGTDLDRPGVGRAPWPDVTPDLEDVTVGVVRTDPALEARETEAFVLEAIRAAERLIYLENQYLSARCVARALIERLQEPDGPAVVLVGPKEAEGWLEEASMGLLRARILRRLRAADRHGRLRTWRPVAEDGSPVYVHSKVLVVDDRLAYVGSANLSARSMGLDTELGLAFDAEGRPDVARALAALRDGLLAEHLGTSRERVAEAVAAPNPVEALDALRGPPPSVAELEDEIPEWVEAVDLDPDVIDPPEPTDVEGFFKKRKEEIERVLRERADRLRDGLRAWTNGTGGTPGEGGEAGGGEG